MMPSEFEKKIDFVTGHRTIRNSYANKILENKELFSELIEICVNPSSQKNEKAFWILELVCYEKLEWLHPYLDMFCSNIKNLTNDRAIRPASKICMLLTISHFKKKEITLSENQLHQITENCFDWLIKENKVAAKCYSIRSLYLLGNHFKWIRPELKIILEKDYPKHSPAYKAVAREILRKIK